MINMLRSSEGLKFQGRLLHSLERLKSQHCRVLEEMLPLEDLLRKQEGRLPMLCYRVTLVAQAKLPGLLRTSQGWLPFSVLIFLLPFNYNKTFQPNK